MASDKSPKEILDAARDAAFVEFNKDRAKGPTTAEVALSGSPIEALESSFAALRARFERGEVALAIVAFVGPGEDDGSGPAAGIEVISAKLHPADLVAFQSFNMPAQVADNMHGVLRKTLDSQIKEFIARRMAANSEPEKGN